MPPDPRAHFERRSEFIETIFNQPCLSELETFFMANRKNKTPIWTETDLNQKLDDVSIPYVPFVSQLIFLPTLS